MVSVTAKQFLVTPRLGLILGLYALYLFTYQYFLSGTELSPFLRTLPMLAFSGYILFDQLRKGWLKDGLLIGYVAMSLITSLATGDLTLLIYDLCFALIMKMSELELDMTKFVKLVLILILPFYALATFNVPSRELYGLIPFVNDHKYQLSFGIHIFPNSSLTMTSIFGLYLFFLFDERNLTGRIIQLVGIYLMVFAASRTAILLFVFGLAQKYYLIHRPKMSVSYSVILLVLPALLISSQVLLTFIFPEQLSFLITKGKEGYSLLEDPRTLTFAGLTSLYIENPILGVGNFDFKSYLGDLPFSELRWLNLLTSNGIGALFLFVYFWKRMISAIRNKRFYEYLGLFFMIFIMTYYGSFMLPYDFFMLLNLFIIMKPNGEKTGHLLKVL